MNMNDNETKQLKKMRVFYDTTYYKSAMPGAPTSHHLRRLARRLGIRENQQVLDVACGVGQWLQACNERGATPSGVDLSEKAIMLCKTVLPQGEFHSSPAEALPFKDNRFDVVTCLGALEHFIDPTKALKEMIRVAKQDATFLLLVPNADFLTRRLGFYAGTHQVDAKEEVRTLSEWKQFFNESGLMVQKRWRDLHVLSWAWVSLNGLCSIPLRAAQAIALTVWPLRWQYQVYHLCKACTETEPC